MKDLRKFFVLFACMLIQVDGQAQKFEAENAILTGGSSIVTSANASNGSYVSMGDGNLSFVVNLDQPGYYQFYIQAASPHGSKINMLALNDATLSFALQGSSFQHIQLLSGFHLEAGTHQVEIRSTWGWINIDYIEFRKASQNPVQMVDQQLVNPETTPETKALYDFLLDNYGRKIISGVMTLTSQDESDWLRQNTGKEPALLGIDFMHCGREYSWYNDSIPVYDAIRWYGRDGIPALMWHWRDPSRETEEFYTEKTNFDLSLIYDKGSAEYQAILKDIDYVAGFLQLLQEKNVPVLWRPLHEAAGGWFWWGAKGPDPFKQLFYLMYDRLVNYHQLDNLIWVWTREPNDADWYPGDDFIDIVGRDIYKTGDHSSQALEFNHMNFIYSGKKMLALSECGSFPDAEELVADEVNWSWFMPWYGMFTRDATYNPLSHWQHNLDHDYVITLDEMPALKNYTRKYLPTAIDQGVQRIDQPLKAYPTTFQERLTVEYQQIIEQILVYSATGRLVKSIEGNDRKMDIILSDLPRGMYLIKVGSYAVKVIRQ